MEVTKIMMAYLSGYGVKVVLPFLVKGVSSTKWRAKVANIWALGNMAYCAPK